jgi:DNA-binding response OmpR family regulator
MEFETEKIKVCIVEDEEMIRQMYKDKFQHEGFLVITANDGEEGFRLIKDEKPDIILADIMMPNQDGIGLMKQLKQEPSLSKIPVIVLTNLDDNETAEKTADFNVDFYLVKSQHSPSDVVNLVKEVLDSRHIIV